MDGKSAISGVISCFPAITHVHFKTNKVEEVDEKEEIKMRSRRKKEKVKKI